MAKLIFILDGNVIKDYPLDKERITIGRRASNDVHIDNLAISGEHAEIIATNDEYYIQDLNSTNGTLVNKKPIKKQVLQHGDAIGLGKYQLKFVKDLSTVKPSDNGFADTVLVAPEQQIARESVEPEKTKTEVHQDVEVTDSNIHSEEDASSNAIIDPSSNDVDVVQPQMESATPRLEVLNGDNAGISVLLDKTMVKLGQPGQQVALVTKRHDGYYLTHVAGNQRPIVNGKVIGAKAYLLVNNDEIELLTEKMEYRVD
jgi:hypothetical protein